MKKFKTLIACFLAAATLSGTFTCMPIAFATEAETEIEADVRELPLGIDNEGPVSCYMTIYEYGILDEVIKEHYGENVIIKKPHIMPGGQVQSSKAQFAYVLTEDCEIHVIEASYQRFVTMKDGTYPPVEKIREILHPDFYYPDFTQLRDNKSTFHINFTDDSPANEILLNDENVVSIDEKYLVHEYSIQSPCFDIIGQIERISGITIDELFDEYGDVFNLSVPIELETGYMPDGVYCELEKSEETYNALKKLFESDIDFVFGNKDFSSSTLGNEISPDDLMAPAEDYVIGDINADGVVDMSDLSELSLILLGENFDWERKIVDIDGDTKVNLTDLATLKQYLSKQISSLGQNKKEPISGPVLSPQ